MSAPWLIKLRRMLGLFVFFYALLHFTTYIWLDQFFDWQEILLDIPKRPFITIGFVSFVLLVPLVITSTSAMQRRLKKKWITIHKLVYVIPVLVVIHFIWSLKADYSEPIVYALIFSGLMLVRVYYSRKKASKV
jgi:sulfoxide reductase heme-binding subunit YedZ